MATSSTASGKKLICFSSFFFDKADECVKPSSQPETRAWNLSFDSVCNPSLYSGLTQMSSHTAVSTRVCKELLYSQQFALLPKSVAVAFLWLADSHCLLGSLSLHFAPWTSAAFPWTLRIVLWSWRAVSMKPQQEDVSVWNYGHVPPANKHKNPLYIMCWLENTLHNLGFNLDDVMRLQLPPTKRFS